MADEDLIRPVRYPDRIEGTDHRTLEELAEMNDAFREPRAKGEVEVEVERQAWTRPDGGGWKP